MTLDPHQVPQTPSPAPGAGSPPAHAPAAEAGTRDRILQAAGDVFAERGYQDATVRDICARAGVNVAAINYHFGDKAALYTEVIDAARRWSEEHYPTDFSAVASPEERLRLFINAMILKLFDRGRPSWHAQLMCREMVAPTPEFDKLVERAIKPQFKRLRDIVAELLGEPRLGSEDPRVELCAFSIVGQCLHHRHCRAVTQAVMPGFLEGPCIISSLTEHVARFSLAALAGMRAAREGAR